MPDPVSPPPPDGYAAYVSDRRKTDANYLRALSIFHALLAVFTEPSWRT